MGCAEWHAQRACVLTNLWQISVSFENPSTRCLAWNPEMDAFWIPWFSELCVKSSSPNSSKTSCFCKMLKAAWGSAGHLLSEANCLFIVLTSSALCTQAKYRQNKISYLFKGTFPWECSYCRSLALAESCQLTSLCKYTLECCFCPLNPLRRLQDRNPDYKGKTIKDWIPST